MCRDRRDSFRIERIGHNAFSRRSQWEVLVGCQIAQMADQGANSGCVSRVVDGCRDRRWEGSREGSIERRVDPGEAKEDTSQT